LLSAPVPGPDEDPAEALPRAPKQSPPELVVSFWNTGEGLPVNEILDLKQTPDGYLWLGTHHGLVRFDGVQFETFFRAPRGLRYGARIAPLEVDDRGRLWAAPDASALICLEAGAFSDVLTNVAFLRARVVSLCGDGTNGVLWVDAEGGLGRIPMDPAGQVKLLAGEAGGASRWMRDFAGQLWLATPRSLRLYQSGGWRQVVAPARTTMVAAPRRAGGIWIAREAALRYVTADGSMRAVADFPWRGQSRVNCMWEDRHQRLWIGTVSQGLFCYASGQFEQVVPTSSCVTRPSPSRQTSTSPDFAVNASLRACRANPVPQLTVSSSRQRLSPASPTQRSSTMNRVFLPRPSVASSIFIFGSPGSDGQALHRATRCSSPGKLEQSAPPPRCQICMRRTAPAGPPETGPRRRPHRSLLHSRPRKNARIPGDRGLGRRPGNPGTVGAKLGRVRTRHEQRDRRERHV